MVNAGKMDKKNWLIMILSFLIVILGFLSLPCIHDFSVSVNPHHADVKTDQIDNYKAPSNYSNNFHNISTQSSSAPTLNSTPAQTEMRTVNNDGALAKTNIANRFLRLIQCLIGKFFGLLQFILGKFFNLLQIILGSALSIIGLIISIIGLIITSFLGLLQFILGSVQALILFFGIVLSIIGLVITIQNTPWISDFSVSVNDMIVPVEQNETNNAKIVDTFNTKIDVIPGFLYNKDICLRSESVPFGIHVHFKPNRIGGKSTLNMITDGRKSVSKVTIKVDKPVNPEEYLISVACLGSDGKEHICKFLLNITPATPIIT